jgi:predicted kinase
MLYIIRGLPGSGKSTLAYKLGVAFFEPDMFAMHNGRYEFDRNKLPKAIKWCFNSVLYSLKQGMDCAAVGTFTKVEHFQDYIKFCEQVQIPYKVIHCLTDFGNIHNVPKEVLDKMKSEMENYPGELYYGGDLGQLMDKLWK